MITFALIRYGVFAAFMFLDGLVGIFSALNLGFVANLPTNDEIKAIGIYLITLSLLVILFIFPILGVEITKKRAITSRVWFECLWVAIFTGLHFGGAVGATIRFPDALCRFGGAPQIGCNTSVALLVFIWASSFLHISYLLLLVVMALFARERVWNQPVNTYAWFGVHQSRARGQPIMGYETPLRFSESSEGTIKEKGWNFLPLNNHSSEKFEVPILPSSYDPPKPVDYLEGVRIEQFRLERHPFQVADPLPQPPPPAKVANPATYRTWEGPVKVEPLPPPPSENLGLSPVEFKVGLKTKIIQAPGTRITQQELSLYPQAVTNAGLNTRPISGLSTSSPIIGGRRKEWSPGHMAVSSVESTTTPVSSGRRERERAPKHRPPPLDLSSLSNLNSSSNRRR